MDQLFKLKNTFIEYLSPKRRRTVGPATPPHAADAAEQSYLPASEPKDKKSKAALGGKVNQKHLSPSDTRFAGGSKKRPREEDEYADHDFEVSPDESISQVTPAQDSSDDSGSDATPTSEPEESEEGTPEAEEVDADQKVQEYLDRQAELALRKGAIDEVKAEGTWHEDEVYLFERLSMRSFEELLPSSWQVDFPTLPKVLFTSDPVKAFISFNCGSSSRGVRALQSLMGLGDRVTDKIQLGRPTERLMAKEVESYIKWSEMDGGYNKMHFIPVLTVVAAAHREAISSISDSITEKMENLAKQHREDLKLDEPRPNEVGEIEIYSRQPPLLYGIIIAQSMAIFVTLDSADPEAKLRHVAHFDFKDKGVNVWNGAAIAIIVIVARNYMMSIKDELEPDDQVSSDPDA